MSDFDVIQMCKYNMNKYCFLKLGLSETIRDLKQCFRIEAKILLIMNEQRANV